MLRCRVGDHLIQTFDVVCRQTNDLTTVSNTDEQHTPCSIDKGDKLGGEAVGVGDIALELMARVFAVSDKAEKGFGGHDLLGRTRRLDITVYTEGSEKVEKSALGGTVIIIYAHRPYR